ncbi:MAG: DNA-binding protein, partial [Ktedonobacteraceae bacterium]
DGEEIELPQTLYVLLRQIVHYLCHERAVTIVSFNKELAAFEAADILNVSYSYLIKLLEEGAIPSTNIKTCKRINFIDLMDYKKQHKEKTREGLAELTRLSEEMGLYDL